MNNLSNKIILYLGRTPDFLSEVKLQDDGNGAYIKEWNVDEAQPTQEQLDALDAQATTLGSNKQVDETRREAYGDWQKQLDEIYHDIDAWKVRLQAIKDANAKE